MKKRYLILKSIYDFKVHIHKILKNKKNYVKINQINEQTPFTFGGKFTHVKYLTQKNNSKKYLKFFF